MILDINTALKEEVIHLTEDNISSLRQEYAAVRDAVLEKYPDTDFPHILPFLDPDNLIPAETLVDEVLNPPADDSIYEKFGWTIKAHNLPYSFYLVKWIGVQLDIETPCIEELMMWHQKMKYGEEQVHCRNSHWRYEYFQKRRALLKSKLSKMLQKEIIDLLMVTEHFKSGRLVEETGFLAWSVAFFQRKILCDAEESFSDALGTETGNA